MDLNTAFAAGTAVIELTHPVTGEVLMDDSEPPKPMSLTVIGKHTKEYKKIERRIGFLALKRNKKLNIESMTFDEFDLASIENEDSTVDLHANMITKCNIVKDGKQLTATPKEMIKLLSDERCAWISEQLTEALEDNDLFFKS